MSEPSPALAEIYNFCRINENLGTSGQPREEQFRAIAESGYQAVINIALPTSDNALANEGSIVTRLGMSYFHIPVDFAAPTTDDFQAFCGVMKALENRKVFVHCAANKRVAAFVYVYRVLSLKTSPAEAEEDLKSIWEPDPVWKRFIDQQISKKYGHG